jgi:hypothetical protein
MGGGRNLRPFNFLVTKANIAISFLKKEEGFYLRVIEYRQACVYFFCGGCVYIEGQAANKTRRLYHKSVNIFIDALS